MTNSLFHTFVIARELENVGDLLAVYASSDIDVFPHQVAAAQFALHSTALGGVILADEGSLGKTYEALLIAVQKWYEGAKVAIVVPTPLGGGFGRPAAVSASVAAVSTTAMGDGGVRPALWLNL